jgi:hypothetical protein
MVNIISSLRDIPVQHSLLLTIYCHTISWQENKNEEKMYIESMTETTSEQKRTKRENCCQRSIISMLNVKNPPQITMPRPVARWSEAVHFTSLNCISKESICTLRKRPLRDAAKIIKEKCWCARLDLMWLYSPIDEWRSAFIWWWDKNFIEAHPFSLQINAPCTQTWLFQLALNTFPMSARTTHFVCIKNHYFAIFFIRGSTWHSS